ncbi:MAG: MmgE/PrpD family protein [Pseudomonadota bacterium]
MNASRTQNGSSLDTAARMLVELRHDAIPAGVVEKARSCVFYGLGIGIACLAEPFGKIAVQSLAALDGSPKRGGATALLTGRKMPTSAAAFCNALLFHGRCQEDTCGAAHLGVAVVPTVLALMESGLARPGTMIDAVIAGYQVAGVIEQHYAFDTTAHGHRASPLYGTIAAATAAAKVLDLPFEDARAALALAVSFSGGILQSISDGTDEWRFQMGSAVRRGLEAALLARAGARGTPAALDGAQGFGAAFAGRQSEEPLRFDKWNLGRVAFKLFPICNRNQTAALLATKVRSRVAPDQIARIVIRISPNVLAGMQNRGPFARIGETLMSTYFCCATALVHGSIDMRSLRAYDDARVQAMIARMTIELDPSIAFPSAMAEVETSDGERFAMREEKRPEDYSFAPDEVKVLIERLADEVKVPRGIVHRLHAFAFGAEPESVAPVLEAFAEARAAAQSGKAPIRTSE